MALGLRLGDVEVDPAVEVQQAWILAGTHEAGHHADGDRAVAADDERDLVRTRDGFDPIGDRPCRLDNEREVLCPPVFGVGTSTGRWQVAVVDDVDADPLEAARAARRP